MATDGEYIRLEKLGQGSFGVVYKCQHRETGEVVALKSIQGTLDSNGVQRDGVPRDALREMSILMELSTHPNIVSLRDIILENGRVDLIFEYCPQDLYKYIKSVDEIPMDKIKSLMYQLLRGILFCHQRRVMHRDLKPENLLLDHAGNLKIADFGIARAFNVPVRRYSTLVTSLWYRAPEILISEISQLKYSCSVDMWAVGCIFSELVTKQGLFGTTNENDQVKLIRSVMMRPEATSAVSSDRRTSQWREKALKMRVPRLAKDPKGIDLLLALIVMDPEKRMSAKHAIAHPFFDDFDKSTLPEFDEDLV